MFADSTPGTATVRVTFQVGDVTWSTVVDGIAEEQDGEVRLFRVDVDQKALARIAEEEFAGIKVGQVFGKVASTITREVLAFTPSPFTLSR